jgi:methylmalonyl-CoA mutase C-terminal domain/subunit
VEYFQKIISEMQDQGIQNVLVFGGGVIPTKDIELLHEIGVGRIFTPGSSLDEIPIWLRDEVNNGEH